MPTISGDVRALTSAGLRFGNKGTHTSRTMMLSELSDLLAAVPDSAASREDYASAIIESNVLGKETGSNRRLTNQRLGELYGLDTRNPVFRAMQRVWIADPQGRPLIALLCALARDPLLRATAAKILSLRPGEELVRSEFLPSIRDHVETRLNDSTLNKVARNAASTWTQSGHLKGRVRKKREMVTPTPGSVAFALWLGSLEGRVGEDLLASFWCSVFDGPKHAILQAALHAKQLGLIKATVAGDIVQLDPSPLLPRAIGV